MSTQSWRRGGPDKLGEWEAMRDGSNIIYRCRIESLDPSSFPNWEDEDEETADSESAFNLENWQCDPAWLWRPVGPLPGETEPREESKKGDRGERRKAFRAALEEWNLTHRRPEDVAIIEGDEFAFLESPAGRPAVLSLWGEDEQESYWNAWKAKQWDELLKVADELFQRSPKNPNPPFEHLLEGGDDKTVGGLRVLAAEASRLSAALAEARKEIERLRRLYETEEAQHGDTVDDRDHREEQVTAIYHALGGENEWSNLHDLGEEALELAQQLATERESLKATIERMQTERHEDSAINGDAIASLAAERDALKSQLETYAECNRRQADTIADQREENTRLRSRLSAPSESGDAKTEAEQVADRVTKAVVAGIIEDPRAVAAVFTGLFTAGRDFIRETRNAF